MATNDNTQVNSFVKGMNSDVSYSMLQDGQYTFAKNIRITQMNKIGDGLLTNGQGDIRPIEGVEVHGTTITPKSILATGSIRDIGVIVYVDSKDNTWKVGVFKNGSPEDISVIFQSEEEAQVEKFSIVLHHEIEDLDKLYIADGVNPIKLILIKQVDGNFVDVTKEEVESYPKMLLNPPHFSGLVEGQLKAGMVQYAYRLYKKYSISTDISPTTNLIPIVNHKTLRGYNQGHTTNSGVELFIEMNKKYDFLDRIQIFRVHYEENGQLPIISIIYDDAVSKLIFPDSTLNKQTDLDGRVYYITFIDNGRVELGQISLEEFNSMLGQRIIPKVIESKNDYMFAAQIKDVQSDVFKGVSKKDFGTVSYELVYIDLIGDGSQLVGDGITHNTITSKLSLPNWNFNYTGNEGDNIYSVLHDYSVYSNPMYSNPKVSYNLKSLRDGETYRYGIVLYNSNGESSGVIYLDDVTIKRDRPTFKIGSGYELIITPVGIKWTFEKFPEGTAAYEIVRCRRTEADMRSISQGVLSRPVKRYKWQNDSVDDNYPYTPTGFVTLQNFVFTQDYWDRPTSEHKILYHSDNLDNKTLFQFISPEACYNPDAINGITKDTDINLSVITALYQPLNKTNSVNITNYTISGYYHAAYNNALLQYESTNIGDRQIPVIGFATGGYYDIDGKFSHNENPYGSAFYRVDGGNRGDRWSYIPATDKSLDLVDPVYLDWDDVKSIKERSFAYIKLYATTAAGTPLTNNSNKYEIHSCKTVSSLQWNEIWNGKTSSNSANNTYEDHITIVGTSEYNNAIVGPWYGENIKVQDKGEGVLPVDTDFEPVFSTEANNKIDYQNSDFIFSASGGDCAIINTGSELNLIKYEDLPINYLKSRMESDQFLYTYLCNITKETIPYGGTSDSAIKNSVYYSYGDYNNSTNNTFVTFNGDTFIEPFEYVSMHKIYYSVAGDTVPSHMICYSIPVETSMNLTYSYGYGFSQNYAQNPNISNIQSQPSSVLGIYNQSKPLYAYNNVYSTNGTSRLFAAAEDEDSNAQAHMDYRVMHSNLKSNGEYIDSWLKYQPANYIDVDSKYGEITHLRKFNNKLFFWQDQATGLLSVNERTQITDESNLPLILGNGGVLDRYDYIDDTAGMKKEQYCDTMSDKALYWYDDHNNEIKRAADGSGLMSLTKAYGVQNIMHTYDDNNKPWMFYDKKYNEVVLDLSDTIKQSIVFNENINAFTSIYDVGFDGAVTFKDGIYLLDTYKDEPLLLGKWNEGNVSNFDGKINTYIEYVVNKNPLVTKVFDNQEIVSSYLPDIEGPDKAWFSENHTYSWKTDLNAAEDVYYLQMTNREGNYRFAIPRANNAAFGNRIRGKYMICSIEDTAPEVDASISYIITKFRTSWS